MAITRITWTNDDGSGTTGTIVNNAQLQSIYDSIETSWAWDSYTPTWGNSGTANTLGNGTLVGAYHKIGKTVIWRVTLNWGSTTSSGSGNWTFTVPLTTDAYGDYGANVMLLDSSPGVHYVGGIVPQSTTVMAVHYYTVNAAAGGNTPLFFTNISGTAPFTWATSDALEIRGCYQAA